MASRSLDGLTPRDHARNMILGAIELTLRHNGLAEREAAGMTSGIEAIIEKEKERLETRWGFGS